MGSTTFDGWPAEATALLADIAADNRADRWPELREGHAALVRGPTLALAAELEAEFGPVRVFRPHAARRFRPDAPPLRTDTGGVATSPGGCGMAVVLSVDAVTVTVGHWRFDARQRRRYRAAVDDVEAGETLAGLLRRLAASGLPADPEGELQILPRGWKPDHPRVWLARRRGLQVGGGGSSARGWRRPSRWSGCGRRGGRPRRSWSGWMPTSARRRPARRRPARRRQRRRPAAPPPSGSGGPAATAGTPTNVVGR